MFWHQASNKLLVRGSKTYLSLTPKRVEIWAKGNNLVRTSFYFACLTFFTFQEHACRKSIWWIIEQLFLAKLSLTSFLNQLVHLFSTSCWLLSIWISSCDMKKETFGTKKEYPLLHLKMHCSTTNDSYIISSRRKKCHAISSEAFFLLTLMSSSVT